MSDEEQWSPDIEWFPDAEAAKGKWGARVEYCEHMGTREKRLRRNMMPPSIRPGYWIFRKSPTHARICCVVCHDAWLARVPEHLR
jgi:hypothetical protein